MRGKRYSYHKNYAPFVPNGQFLPYMHNMIATPAWNKLHKEGKTNAVTGRFFRPRPSEEFYDNEVDFDNVNNLISKPLKEKLKCNAINLNYLKRTSKAKFSI